MKCACRVSLGVLAVVAAACSPESDPNAPSPSFAREGRERSVQMLDACDPESFNAVLGAGTCTRNGGGVTFDRFIALLERNQTVGSWRFSPTQVTVHVGDVLIAVNRGGEVHTFTEVEAFGGGFIPELNALSGSPVPAPECLLTTLLEFVPPGGHVTETDRGVPALTVTCTVLVW